MFRATVCPSSGENYCIYASGLLVGVPLQTADQTPPIQSDKYQCRIDTVIVSWWWAHYCPNHV